MVPEIDCIPVENEVCPESADELAHIMKEAHAAGLSVIPAGGATRLHLGNPPRSAQLAVLTTRLRGVVEYEPGNLTVSVRAGTSLQELQQTLRAKDQFLPLDPPFPERATVGGIVAGNASGPIRFRYGTARDMLLGIKIVHADGTHTKAGGKLVKNVAGYDMCKLYTGSLGTLGILTELTFRVQPVAESVATVSLAFPSLAAALEAVQACLRSDLMPDALEALNDIAFEDLAGRTAPAPWILLVRFGEMDAAVRWQVDQLRGLAGKGGGTLMDVLATPESRDFWLRASSVREQSGSGDTMLLKCSVLRKSVAEIERQMRELGNRLQARTSLYCHAGNCILYGRLEWEAPVCDAGDVRREIATLRSHCIAAGGHLVVERVRCEVKRGLDVWGYDTPALAVMRRIKQLFDPKGQLNPGRFVGGI